MNNAMKMAMLSRWKDSLRGTEYPIRTYRSEALSQTAQEPQCGTGKYPARRRELFSLRKKRTAGIRLSAWQKAGSLYRLNHPFFRP